MAVKYVVMREDRASSCEIYRGDFVYQCIKHDYGAVSMDDFIKKIEHIAMTLDPEGGYPFFTIPKQDIGVAE